MKNCFVFVVFLLALPSVPANREEAIATFTNAALECITKGNQATQADVAMLFIHGPAITLEGKCLKFCLFKNLKLMEPNGQMNENAIFELVLEFFNYDSDKAPLIKEAINACKTTVDPNENINGCEAADKIHTCIKKEFDLRGLDI